MADSIWPALMDVVVHIHETRDAKDVWMSIHVLEAITVRLQVRVSLGAMDLTSAGDAHCLSLAYPTFAIAAMNDWV